MCSELRSWSASLVVAPAVQGQLRQVGDRRRLVRDADHQDAHPLVPLFMPCVVSSILRCSWKARIWSSWPRSTLRTLTPFGHDENGRCKVEDAGDSQIHEAVSNGLSGLGRGRDDRDGRARPGHHVLQLDQVGDGQAMDPLADQLRGRIDQPDHPEAAAVEAAVVGQRGAQVAQPDDDHRPVVGRAHLAADLAEQVLHVVADPPGAVRAEMGQVLAQLGGVDPGRLGERATAHGVDLLLSRAAARLGGTSGAGRRWRPVSP